MPDLDGDAVPELAVGAIGDDDGRPTRGAVWILFLNADGTVKSHQKISLTDGGFQGPLDAEDWFGASLAVTSDVNGDGIVELIVGAPGDDDGPFTNSGALWILSLCDATVSVGDPEGTVAGPRVHPQPATRVVTIPLTAARPLRIHDVSGAWITTLRATGGSRLTWDLTDAAGNRVAPGVYFASVEGERVHRVVVRYSV